MLQTDLQPYPTYKDSGVPWLDQLPAHWKILRGKNVFTPIDVRSTTGEEELLTVSSKDGVVPRREKQVTMFMAASYVGHKLCWPGDLVINSLWAWATGLGFSRYHGIISSAYGVYRPLTHFTGYVRFFNSLLRSAAYDWELHVRSKGIWTSRLQLTDESFLDMPIIIPPADEAEQIARYLDHFDRRVNRYIRAKRKLIALLNEQKQAIIHRAVTRGLDPDVALRPSGVAWLGEIPAHWEVRKLKHLGEVKIGLTYSPSDVLKEGGLLVLRASNIRNGRIVSADNVYVAKAIPQSLLVTEGDILICVRSGSRNLVGKSALITQEMSGVTYGAFMSLLRSEINAFLYWVLNSNLLPSVMAEFETSTINQLTQSDLRELIIPVPPAAERNCIVDFLVSQTARIVNAIDFAQAEISLLREYRARLIADVVTGKLDVRAAAVGLAEEREEEVWLEDEMAGEDGEAFDDSAPEEALEDVGV